jgi:hypothetical protein
MAGAVAAASTTSRSSSERKSGQAVRGQVGVCDGAADVGLGVGGESGDQRRWQVVAVAGEVTQPGQA